jgi:branched-chain amino acid aminotransferase
MGLAIPWSVSDMIAGVEALLALEPVGTQYVRPIAYRRAPELWVTGSADRAVDVSIFTVRIERDSDHSISCQLSPIERVSSRSIPGQTKVSGAYVNSFYARHTAERAGFEDGIMLDRRGLITEASAANVFFIRGERLLTPTLSNDIFPGITRQVLLEIAGEQGIEVAEREIGPADLSEISGCLLCSTLMEVRGVNRLDTRPLATSETSVFKALVTAFRKLTHQ